MASSRCQLELLLLFFLAALEHTGEEKPLTCGGGDLPLGGIFIGEKGFVCLVLSQAAWVSPLSLTTI
jgi:hypothetical protein